MNTLFKFGHGLGDTIQFQIVLRHLQRFSPQEVIDVEIARGKHTALEHLCNHVYVEGNGKPSLHNYQKRLDIEWWEANEGYSDLPSTKVTRCLKKVFGLEPQLDLYYYDLPFTETHSRIVDEHLNKLCTKLESGKYPIVCIHYEGNTSTGEKNLDHNLVSRLCDLYIQNGYKILILDWDNRSPLLDGNNIYCFNKDHEIWGKIGTGDAVTLAALINSCSLFIGVDSGPLHIAGATTTPTIGVWTKHHPVKFFDIADNTRHFVPEYHTAQINKEARNFFEQNYRHYVYDQTDLAIQLFKYSRKLLNMSEVQETDNWIKASDFWVRKDNYEQDMVIVKDIYQQDAYRLKLIPGIIDQSELVVDVGAHIGCFATLIHKLNPKCKIICVEACPENIPLLTKNVGEFATVIHAACTYEDGELMLLNAVRPNCESTGGSVVVPKVKEDTTDQKQAGYAYRPDHRLLEKITLEQIMQQVGCSKIGLLKLDCEGSEISILSKTPSLDKIRFVVGEYHQIKQWEKVLKSKFSQWDYGLMWRNEQMGLFHLSNRNTKTVLTIAVPSGIGDSIWAMTKIQSLMKQEGCTICQISVQDGEPKRSKELLERLDFVQNVKYFKESIMEVPLVKPDGTYNYTATQSNWHDKFDWLLIPNESLEQGIRLEDWHPEWEINWNIANHIKFKDNEIKQAEVLRQRLGKYCVLYASSLAGNTNAGHNRGPRWRPEQWVQLSNRLRNELKVAVVLIGANWDRDYYDKVLLPAGFIAEEVAIGNKHICETLQIIKKSEFFIGYQSGLGVMASYLGTPAAMWWRQQKDSILPNQQLGFDERMASAWVPPKMIEEKKYLSLYYGRETVDDIVNSIKLNGWVK